MSMYLGDNKKIVYFGDLENGAEFEWEFEVWRKIDRESAKGDASGVRFFHGVCKVKVADLSKAFVRGWEDKWFGMGIRGINF